MKERMRANLPGFGKLFDLLLQKAEMIGKLSGYNNLSLFCEGVSVDMYGDLINNDLPKLGTVGAPQYSLGFNAGASAIGDLNALITQYIGEIKAGAQSLSNSCLEVTKELGDSSPVYMSFSEGSIESYRMRYGKTPLTPLSLALFAVGDNDKVNADGKQTAPLLPTGKLGEDGFKFLYGTRGLLPSNNPVTFDSLVGVKTILDQYNASAPTSAKIDNSDYLQFVQQSVTALRWVAETQFYKNMLATKPIGDVIADSYNISSMPMIKGTVVDVSLIAYDNKTSDYYKNTPVLALRTFGKGITTIISIVEDDDQAAEVDILVDFLRGKAKSDVSSREEQQVLNIIDMNVMPINVHALMRGVPLANLYNYNYTFDRMAANLYGEDANDLLTQQTNSPRRLFLQLLNDPYKSVSWGHTTPDHDSLHRIFRGDANLGMGRPKFLSDQLYNKALLSSIYPAGLDAAAATINQDVGAAGSAPQMTAAQKKAADVLRQILNAAKDIKTLSDDFTKKITELNITYVEEIHAATVTAGGGPATAALLNAAHVTSGAGADKTDLGVVAAVPFDHPRLIARLQINETAAVIVVSGVNVPTAAAALTPAGVAAVKKLRKNVVEYLSGDFKTKALKVQQTVVTINDLNRSGGVVKTDALILAATVANPFRDNIVTEIGQGITSHTQLLAAIAPGFDGTSTAAVLTAINDANIDGVFNVFGADVVNKVSLTRASTLVYRENAIVAAILADPNVRRLITQNVNPAAGSTFLSYIKNDTIAAHGYGAPVLKTVEFEAPLERIEGIAQSRFDTRFVRNLFFITNVVRLLRLKLNRELTQSRNVVVSSHFAVASGITEYGTDPFGVNQVMGTTTVQNRAQFNFEDKF